MFFVEGPHVNLLEPTSHQHLAQGQMPLDQRCLCRIEDVCFSFLFLVVTVSFTWHEHNKLLNEILPSQQTAQQDVWCFVTPFVVMIKRWSEASAGVPIEIQEIYVRYSLHMV